MTRFQIFLVAFFGVIAVASLAAMLRGRARGTALMILIVAVGACAAAIWPDATTDIAHWVGIKRGTDLILYCMVLVMMTGFFMFYIRLRHLRRELTLVVRHVAMLEASEKSARGDGSEPVEVEAR